MPRWGLLAAMALLLTVPVSLRADFLVIKIEKDDQVTERVVPYQGNETLLALLGSPYAALDGIHRMWIRRANAKSGSWDIFPADVTVLRSGDLKACAAFNYELKPGDEVHLTSVQWLIGGGTVARGTRFGFLGRFVTRVFGQDE